MCAQLVGVKKSCSFMVTNFNGEALLRQILPSVLEAIRCNGLGEVVVVDDAGSDGSVEMLKRDFPTVRVLELKQNVGFQEASNRGVEFCKNRLVICLNNDMKVESDCCERLAAHFDDPLVFSVSTRVLMWDKKTYLAGRRYPSFDKANFILNDEDAQSLSKTLFATGGGCMLDRDKFLDMGGFDGLYLPLYWEDVDLSYRAWKRGYTVLYDPSVVFYHKHQATIAEMMDASAIRSVTARNSYLFLWKNITDRKLFVKHLASIVPSLTRNLLRGETRFPAAFMRALLRLPMLVGRRRLEKAESVVADIEIMNKLRDEYVL